MKNILLAGDSKFIFQNEYSHLINKLNLNFIVANNGKDAAGIIEISTPDIIMIEGDEPIIDGVNILSTALKIDSSIPVILFSEKVNMEAAVLAVKNGAFDYIKKPFSPEKLDDVLTKAVLYRENELLKSKRISEHDGDVTLKGVVYESGIMRQIARNIKKLANSKASVFIFGESGTGKELVARNIHRLSPRNVHPFIPVDCVSFPVTLLEGELFGYEKGAFTGAIKSKPGVFELADKGTLFLDEITEMDYHMQAKLLRVLQEKKIRRLGGKVFVDVDVRIVSATNRDPEKAVKEGKLREDLYYRLNVVPVYVPPLRERKEDIPLLVHHFISKYNPTTHLQIKGITKKTLEYLGAYNWPGNIRELENLIHRIMSLTDHNMIEIDDLPEKLKKYEVKEEIFDERLLNLSYKNAKKMCIERFSIEYFSKLLKINGGNVSKTAKIAEISRKTLYRLLNEYNITK